MPRKATNLPVVVSTSSSEDSISGEHELWLRLFAFLSMRSPNTKDTYWGVIREWCEFLGGGRLTTPKDATPRAAELMLNAKDIHAIAYKNWLEKRPGEKPRAQRAESSKRDLQIQRTPRFGKKKEGLEYTQSNATIAKKFAALRRIYRMFMASDLGIKINPFDSDRVPPPPKDSGRKRPTEMLDFDKVKDVISSVEDSSPKGLRDKAILCVLFGGALRRSEVIALRVGDVRKTSQGTTFLYLRSTKAKRDAQQALPPWAGSVVQALVKARKAQGAAEGDYLFTGFTGQAGKTPSSNPISASGVYSLFKRCCMLAGAGKFFSPHSARATAITRLLAEGIPHREVQEFSRHSSIQMVEAYDKRRMGVEQNPAKLLDYD